VKYMLLIYSNAESWAGLSAEQRDGLAEAHESLSRELTEQGLLVSAAGLADPITTRTVQVRDETINTTDGPYAEAKEHLAGFYLIDVASEERAIEIAAKVPEAALGLVEVRPARSLDLSEW